MIIFVLSVIGVTFILYITIKKMLFQKAKDIEGQVVLITGGANGLGKEIAFQLSKLGCKIAIADLDFVNAEKTVQEILVKGGCKDAKAYKVNREKINWKTFLCKIKIYIFFKKNVLNQKKIKEVKEIT